LDIFPEGLFPARLWQPSMMRIKATRRDVIVFRNQLTGRYCLGRMNNLRILSRLKASSRAIIQPVLIGIMALAILTFPFRHDHFIAKIVITSAFARGDGGGSGGGHGDGGHGEGHGEGHGDSGHGEGHGGDEGHGEGHGQSGEGGKGESGSGLGGGLGSSGAGGGGEGPLGRSGLSGLGGFQGLLPVSTQEEAELIGNWGEGAKK